ncbi:MAG: heparinase II/III family protein [Sedimentisphaerales bacterium]|nr:heparinase II/III family protein [Sedimentisphaerales bacterium]
MKNIINLTAALAVVLLTLTIIPDSSAQQSPATTPQPEAQLQQGQQLTQQSPDILTTLKPDHPRLFLTDDQLNNLKKQLPNDELLRKIHTDVIARADSYLSKTPVKHKLKGPRLLSVSRDCLNRIYHCGLAWRLTGEQKYFDKARTEMLAAAEFKDWNPSHFLDTAEMSHALGLGYDWLYHDLDESTRRQIRTALLEKGLQPGLERYYDKPAWWAKSEYNWNQVCNGGLIAGALAIAEENPQAARKILTAAIKSLPIAISSYRPDGAWAEGVGYWAYATNYTVIALDALQTALGKDFNLSNDPGLALAGDFPIYGTSPTGRFVNFADVGENARRSTLPALFWLGRRYSRGDFIANESAYLKKNSAHAHHFIWYSRPISNQSSSTVDQAESKLALDKLFKSKAELALMRSSWSDPEALFVSLKGGSNNVNHCHLDMGSFILEALGVRWAIDLGSDDYNLPGYWQSGSGGQRWSYYRLGSLSHNVVIMDGKNQQVKASGAIVEFVSEPGRAGASLDWAEAYRDKVDRATRRVELIEKRSAVLISDEFDMKEKTQVSWGMATRAEIELKGKEAILQAEGKRLKAQLLSPEGAVFSVESAEQQPPQKTNKGVRRLVVDLGEVSGKVKIVVKFAPQTE